MLAGKYQFRPEPPFIPGGEAAGVVQAVGADVSGFNVGDRVMSRHTLGACAELGNAKAMLCDQVPAGMSMEAAGVFRGAYTTAYHALLQRGRLQRANGCLVHGAAGGIGIAAIQVAKAFGAKVIATAGSEEKRRACLEEGADHAIDYRVGFMDKVRQLTNGRGVDIVYDPIGDKVAEESLRCLAWCGRLLILGFLGGGPTNIKSNYLLIKGIDAIGVRIGGLNEANPALAIANMKALIAMAEQGKLRPRISHTFRLDQAAEALQAVIDRGASARPCWLGHAIGRRRRSPRLPASTRTRSDLEGISHKRRKRTHGDARPRLAAAHAGDPAFLGRHEGQRAAAAALRRLQQGVFPATAVLPDMRIAQGLGVQGERQGDPRTAT